MADATEIVGLDYIGRQTYLDWTQAVARAGGLAIRLPAQSGYEGVLGEKYPESVIQTHGMDTPLVWQRPPAGVRPAGAPPIANISYGLYLAPLKVRVLDKAHMVSDGLTIAAGKGAEIVEDWSKGLVFAIVLGVGGLLYLATRKK